MTGSLNGFDPNPAVDRISFWNNHKVGWNETSARHSDWADSNDTQKKQNFLFKKYIILLNAAKEIESATLITAENRFDEMSSNSKRGRLRFA